MPNLTAERRVNAPPVRRLIHTLAANPGPVEFDRLAELTGIPTMGSMIRYTTSARNRLRTRPGVSLRTWVEGETHYFELTGMVPDEATALLGPSPPLEAYLGHSNTAGRLVRLLVEAGRSGVRTTNLPRLLGLEDLGPAKSEKWTLAATRRVISDQAKWGRTETILTHLVEGVPVMTWSAPDPAVSPSGSTPELDSLGSSEPSDWRDDESSEPTSARRDRAEILITLPNVGGRYVYTSRGLYLDGSRRPRHGSGATGVGAGA